MPWKRNNPRPSQFLDKVLWQQQLQWCTGNRLKYGSIPMTLLKSLHLSGSCFILNSTKFLFCYKQTARGPLPRCCSCPPSLIQVSSCLFGHAWGKLLCLQLSPTWTCGGSTIKAFLTQYLIWATQRHCELVKDYLIHLTDVETEA